ncbi:MAG: hypothetical protein JRJ79_09555 [Deltaproteobacteria bacterium]|nr:hypothetical protein [Deltaproteobacteria bacterium]
MTLFLIRVPVVSFPASLNRVSQKSSGATVPYDANGNTTAIGSKTLTYNQKNRLIRVKEDDATVAEYTYNGLDNG